MRVSWSTPRPRLQVPHAEEGLCTWLPEEGSLESLSWVSGRCLLPFLPKEAPVLSACTENAGGRLVSKGQSKSEPRKLISNLKYRKLSEVNENQVEAT